jgi:hypothetical protein
MKLRSMGSSAGMKKRSSSHVLQSNQRLREDRYSELCETVKTSRIYKMADHPMEEIKHMQDTVLMTPELTD